MTKIRFLADIFATRIFRSKFFPSLLSCFGAGIANVADALMLGISLGEQGLAAVSLVTPVYLLYNVLALGIATGGSVYYAKFMGEGRQEKAVQHFSEVALFQLTLGILTGLLGVLFLPQILLGLGASPKDAALYTMAHDYAEILFLSAPLFFLQGLLLAFVRSDGGAKTASIAFLAGSCLDFVLNVLFVLKLGMGARGAALSTVLGVALGALCCLPYLFSGKTLLKLHRTKPRRDTLQKSFSLGFSLSVQDVLNFFLFIIINHLLLRLGGAAGVAVFDVTLNVSFVVTSVYAALGETMLPMVATFSGEKNMGAIHTTLRLSLRAGFLGCMIVSFLLLFLAGPICALFGIRAATTELYGAFAVRMYVLSALLAGPASVYAFYFQALEQKKKVLLICVLRGFATYVPMAFLCGWLFGIEKIWLMYPLTEAITLLLLFCLGTFRPKALSRQEQDGMATWLIDGEQEMSGLLEQADAFITRFCSSPRLRMKLQSLTEEICSTIFEKGFPPSAEHRYIQVTLLAMEDGSFRLHIRDNAPDFNLFALHAHKMSSVEDTDALENLAVMLIKKNTREHFYHRSQGFNTLVVTVGGD